MQEPPSCILWPLSEAVGQVFPQFTAVDTEAGCIWETRRSLCRKSMKTRKWRTGCQHVNLWSHLPQLWQDIKYSVPGWLEGGY